MPAYNPPQQILFQPVTSFYKGKAIRQQLAAGEQDAELKGLQIKSVKQELKDAPAKREAAEEMARLQLDEIRLNVEKKRGELGDDEMQRRANAYGPIFDQATKMAEDDDLDGAIAYVNKELPIAAEGLGPEVLAEFLESRGEDQHLDKEEISRAKAGISAYWEMYEKDKDSANHSARYKQAVDGGLEPGTPEFNAYVLNEGGGADTGIKSADESYILKMVNGYFGGMLDEASGTWNILDPAKRREAAQVITAATVIFASGATSTRSKAVEFGMKAYGHKWEEPKGDESVKFDIDAAALELNVSAEDLQFTASKRGISVEEVYNSIKDK